MDLSDPYDGFSKVFDRIVPEHKYQNWEAFILSIWNKKNIFPTTLLDIACGTGKNAIRFSQRDIEVFGIDSSLSMLSIAKAKKSSVHFTKGHFLNFNLPKKVDAAICLDFSTNYILRSDEFVDFLNRVYENLNAKGILIFDFKPAKMFLKKEKHLANQDFTFDWVCNLEHAPFVVIDMDTYLKKENQRFKERHIERGYTLEEIRSIVSQTQFKTAEYYDNCQDKIPADSSELIQVVLQKI